MDDAVITTSVAYFEGLQNIFDILFSNIYIYTVGVLTVDIQIMWRGLETGERLAYRESFHPFCAEPHTFYIYCQCTDIVFILQYNLQNKLFNLLIEHDNGNPINTSIVIPIRGVV